VTEAAIILSFDVEEHYRIESAAELTVAPAEQAYYAGRVEPATRWLLEQLGRRDLRATFFIVGQLARSQPGLVRAIHAAGHEVASHGWDHRRLHLLDPDSFRQDLRQSKDALEQLISEAVHGYRAPTFSVVPQTAWAIDVLAEEGLLYDSSIYPVWHDRYGVPGAPRGPFRVKGTRHEMLEIPPVTLRLGNKMVAAGGGGYFRLLPLFVMEHALKQVEQECRPPVAMLYFHPWEFDPWQARLPLHGLNRWRTYVGLHGSRPRFRALLGRHRFVRAIDVANSLVRQHQELPRCALESKGERRGLSPPG
jgi:polysaccharide deacetylase family protein (PEP-CTERM system associated)